MPWVTRYNENRRKKYSENKEYREKRKRQGRTPEENIEYMLEYRKEKPEKFKRTRKQQDKVNSDRRKRYADDASFREEKKRQVKEYYQRNPDVRLRQRLKKYGIGVEEYNGMLSAQNGGCAICGSTDSGDAKKERLHVDHCHSTGIVRGLLCTSCNQGLGKFRDSLELLTKASEYIKKGAHF